MKVKHYDILERLAMRVLSWVLFVFFWWLIIRWAYGVVTGT